MPRVKAPLIEFSDGEVLRMAARKFDLDANAPSEPGRMRFHRAMAARLRSIARRVPLWTQEAANQLDEPRSISGLSAETLMELSAFAEKVKRLAP